MSDTVVSIRRQIASATDLQSVVRSMKALAASSIGQYERSVLALKGYYHAVEIGLGACVRDAELDALLVSRANTKEEGAFGIVVFGSDQGLVGQFNDLIANFIVRNLEGVPGKPEAWCVGERIYARLKDDNLTLKGLYDVPNSVEAIARLVGQIQIDVAACGYQKVLVFHHQPLGGSLYQAVVQPLLPLDTQWIRGLARIPWPSAILPEVMGDSASAFALLVREHLFISLYRACAESLASENASRLAAMQRADRNIDDLLGTLQSSFHRLRQSGIDEELFDVISGFEALSKQ